MQHLPFNPERLLALFMTKENAGSLAGDLEERFQRIWRQKGRMRAASWFWWALLASMPPVMVHALNRNSGSRPTIAAVDSNLLASFFMSWMALEMRLYPNTTLTESSSEGTRAVNPLDNIALLRAQGHLTARDATEMSDIWKRRKELVHRTSNQAPVLTERDIVRLHRLIERLRQSSCEH